MLALIEQTPDIYLDEIQKQLHELHNVNVSLASLYRTLKRLGMSMKKASSHFC
jgi:transposase